MTEKLFAILNYDKCTIWVIDLCAIDLLVVSLIAHINEKYWTTLSSIIY